MHKNAHIEIYISKEKATEMKESTDWRHKTSGFNFISFFLLVFFYIVAALYVQIDSGIVRWRIANFVLQSTVFVLALCFYALHFNSFFRPFFSRLGTRIHSTHLPCTIDSLGEKCDNFIISQPKSKIYRQKQDLNEQLVIPILPFPSSNT